MLGGVGELTPPQFEQCMEFPGFSSGDRQAFTCSNKMMVHHGLDLDGTGVRTTVVNCGDLSGECCALIQVDDGRSPQFASFTPDYAIVDGSPVPVIEDRMIVVEGENGLIVYYTYDVPFTFNNLETGGLHLWDNVVGGPPEGPNPL